MPKRPIREEIKVRRGESIEKAIRRFKKRVKKALIKEELQKRRFYEKPSQKRHREKIRIKKIHEQNKKALKEQNKRG